MVRRDRVGLYPVPISLDARRLEKMNRGFKYTVLTYITYERCYGSERSTQYASYRGFLSPWPLANTEVGAGPE